MAIQRVGWRSFVTQVVNAVDADATAFISAAGITNLTQAAAINTLVNDLKTYGLWTKMKAIYPFVGGNATSHKFNLKDPRDLDAAFRLVFTGGWTHTSTGALPNGTNAYANTFFSEYNNITLADTQQSNFTHLSFYSRTNAPSSTTQGGSIGVYDYNDGWGNLNIVPKRANGQSFGHSRGNVAAVLSTTIDDSRGYFIINRQSTSLLKYLKDNTLLNQNTTLINNGATRNGVRIGAIYDWGQYYYDNKEAAFATMGYSLTDTETTSLYTAVQKFQTSLGRQIGTPVLASGQTAGLLDTYSSASAAYSLRKLRNGYYGFAIRVRRSSDNAEQDIAFKSDGTLDTTSLLAFVGAGNGFVTTWYDQSGYNNHIIQSTALNQPQIVNSGSIILDGTKPAVQFNGTSTILSSTFTGITVSGLTNMSIICACKTTYNNAGSSPLGLMYFGPDSGWGQVSLSIQAQNVGYRFGTGQSSNNPSYNWSSFGGYFSRTILSAYHQGVNEVLRINGVDRLTYNNKLSTIANTGNQFGMGGNYTFGSMLYHQGTISEMIIYPNDQLSNRSTLESDINSYYSIY